MELFSAFFLTVLLEPELPELPTELPTSYLSWDTYIRPNHMFFGPYIFIKLVTQWENKGWGSLFHRLVGITKYWNLFWFNKTFCRLSWIWQKASWPWSVMICIYGQESWVRWERLSWAMLPLGKILNQLVSALDKDKLLWDIDERTGRNSW